MEVVKIAGLFGGPAKGKGIKSILDVSLMLYGGELSCQEAVCRQSYASYLEKKVQLK